MSLTLNVETGHGAEVEDSLVVFPVLRRNGGPYSSPLPDLPSEQLSDFSARRGKTRLLYTDTVRADRCLLVGIGMEEDLEPSDLAELGGELYESIANQDVERATVVFPLGLDLDTTVLSMELSVGCRLADYEFDEYQHDDSDDEDEESSNELESIDWLVEDGRSLSTVRKGCDRAQSTADAVSLGRDLANTPANELVPMDLADRARTMAKKHDNLSVEIWDDDDLVNDGMNLLHAVGKGSEHPPCLIRFHYQPSSPKDYVALAGKGVTFDTGGISIKPSKKMDEMKFDMCGAAAVFGTIRAAVEFDWPLEITGLVPAAENMPGHRSVKPGDVVTGYHGKSVEILNTDAEGRLCLADALGWASEHIGDDIDTLVDFATLTGACITALGHEAAGLMGNDDEVISELEEAGTRVDERVWQLPLWGDHTEQMDSDIADVKNMGGDAGAITAGAFLREFVDEESIDRWAHLDIAGTGWGMEPLSYRPEGGTGFGVRLMIEWLEDRYNL